MKDIKINPLTRIPGGYFLTIEYKDNSVTRSINTKSPYHYALTVVTESILQGKEVRSIRTHAGDVVYENGRFNSKFVKSKVNL